jgi:chromosome partitioning protein
MPVTVSFVGQKGGVGKSTLARAFAAVAARGRLKVKLADLDLNQQTSVRWAKIRVARRNSHPVEAEPYATMREALAGSQGADIVIVDTPGHASPETLEIARSSHVVVLPTGASTDDLYPTVLLLYELEQMGIPKERLAVALCRLLELREEHAARKYVETAGYQALLGSVPERAGYRTAHNQGQSLTETSDQALNGRARTLMESLLEKVWVQLKASKTFEKQNGASLSPEKSH